MPPALVPSAATAAAWRDASPLPAATTRRLPLRRLAGWLIVLLALGGSAAWWWSARSASTPAVYRTTRVQRGDINQTVSATGPLSAVATVDVGSQVSGNIAKLYVDFNDPVSSGQLIAEIDPSTYEARLLQAESDLLGARVAVELKQLNARRSEQLLASHMISQSEYDQAMAELHQQEAVVKIKEGAARNARVDLERTKIRSPIDGVVIDRAIDVGQTVQASFAAPTLFRLAQDLRAMQITANVSEADIGGVAAGGRVAFTVDAFPGETFSGMVRQVRNNTTTSNNVVTYPTIITVANPDLKLRPGMTANVTIIIAERHDVLRVPNAALRFSLTEPAPATPSRPRETERKVHVARGEIDARRRTTGPLEPVAVRTGLGDAMFTEILSGLDESLSVVTGMVATGAAPVESTAPTNPFLPKMPKGGPKR
jgi:HlyD family secretion protein